MFTTFLKPFLPPFKKGRQFTSVTRGEIVRYRKCRFQAAVATVNSEDDIKSVLAEIRSQRKVARATHPSICAWKYQYGNEAISGCDDSGEKGKFDRFIYVYFLPFLFFITSPFNMNDQ